MKAVSFQYSLQQASLHCFLSQANPNSNPNPNPSFLTNSLIKSSIILEQHIIQSMQKQQKKKIRYKDLPVHLQNKYKNSILFQKQLQQPQAKFEFNLVKLKQRKAEKQKTMQQKLQQLQINSTEYKYLLRVFKSLSAKHGHKYFTAEEIKEILRKMNIRMTKTEVERMIWEFDEDLNKKITEKEFINMYKKCTIDKNSAESKNLFHLTQFLMYTKPNTYTITVEDTLELLFVRAKIEVENNHQKPEEKEIIRKLEQEIDVLFEGEEKTSEGLEKQITFQEYLERINKRAIEKRRKEIEKVKSVLKYGVSSLSE